MQTFGGAVGAAFPTATQLLSIASVTQSVGWNSKGIAFWAWDVDPVLVPSLASATWLKDHSESWATVAGIAAQYHEDLYAVVGTTRLNFKRGISRIQITRGGQRVVMKR